MIENLRWMKGQTFSTLAQNRKFTIEDVSDSGIWIKVHSTDHFRQIFNKELDDAWTALTQSGMLYATQVFATGSRSSAFIVTILSKLPGVTYTLNPIRLKYTKPK